MGFIGFVTVLATCAFESVVAFDSDIISDVTTSAVDENRALSIKAEQFWGPVEQAAKASVVHGHAELYDDVERVVASLTPANAHVSVALKNALSKLRQADVTLATQATRASQVAEETLANPAGWESGFSFLTGGQNFISLAIRHFTGRKYQDRLQEHIQTRQATILPVMQDASQGNVMRDCRAASDASFEVLKYDLYNNGVARTPPAVKKLAHRLIDAIAETRHKYTKLVKDSASGIAQDSKGEHDQPTATVTRSLIEGMKQDTEDKTNGLFINIV